VHYACLNDDAGTESATYLGYSLCVRIFVLYFTCRSFLLNSTRSHVLLSGLYCIIVFRGGAPVRVRYDSRHLPNAERPKRRVLQTTCQHCRSVHHHAGDDDVYRCCSVLRSTPQLRRSCGFTTKVYSVQKKTPTYIFFHISMSHV